MKPLRLFINLVAILVVVLLGAVATHAAPTHDHGAGQWESVGLGEPLNASTDGLGTAHDAEVHCGSPILAMAQANAYRPAFRQVDFDTTAPALPVPGPISMDPRPPRT